MAELHVSDDAVRLAGARLGALLLRVADERGRARLAIPGGSALPSAAHARGVLGSTWSHVRLTWVDERCVDEADDRSNRGAARRAGLYGGDDSPEALLPLFEDGEEPDAALARVRAGWRATFESRLDVVLLGMGPDGHIASIFPGAAPVADVAAYVADSPKPPRERITLTRAALATASHTVLVATGTEKRDALRRLLTGDASLPAHGLPQLEVFTDQDLGGS